MSRFSVIQNSSDNWNERKPFFWLHPEIWKQVPHCRFEMHTHNPHRIVGLWRVSRDKLMICLHDSVEISEILVPKTAFLVAD